MSAWILPPWRSLQHRSCKMPCHHLIARWSLHLPKEVSFQQLGSGNSSLSSYLCRLMVHVDLNLKFQNSIPKACTSRALFAHTLLFRRSNSKLCSCQIHLGSHCTPTKAWEHASSNANTDNRCTHPTSLAKSRAFCKFNIESSWLNSWLLSWKQIIQVCTEIDLIWDDFPRFSYGPSLSWGSSCPLISQFVSTTKCCTSSFHSLHIQPFP